MLAYSHLHWPHINPPLGQRPEFAEQTVKFDGENVNSKLVCRFPIFGESVCRFHFRLFLIQISVG